MPVAGSDAGRAILFKGRGGEGGRREESINIGFVMLDPDPDPADRSK
jgi:hypothetical protein